MTESDGASVEGAHGRAVDEGIVVTRSDDSQVVGVFRQVRESVRNLQTGLPPMLESPSCSHQSRPAFTIWDTIIASCYRCKTL